MTSGRFGHERQFLKNYFFHGHGCMKLSDLTLGSPQKMHLKNYLFVLLRQFLFTLEQLNS
jgi:hypothetical protein